jgi:predicted dehydrogenase
VIGDTGEDLVEKQNAETGVMPVVADEEAEYGYVGENRYMVKAFRNGERPWENFEDGLRVTELLMAAYMSAEREETIHLPCPELDTFVPAVARGEWNPRAAQEEA